MIGHDFLTREEMNEAPFAYMDAFHAHRYWDANPQGQIPPQAQVWSSRGCPFKCIFCVWPATMTGNDPDGTGKRSVRHYSADYMEAYLSELVERYDYKSIYFDDDTFNLGNSHVVRTIRWAFGNVSPLLTPLTLKTIRARDRISHVALHQTTQPGITALKPQFTLVVPTT